MDRKLLAILGVGLVVMLITVWIFYPAPFPEISLPNRHFMHCSSCGRELPYNEERAVKGCPQCGATGPLVPTKDPITKSGGLPSMFPKVVPPLLVEANLLLVAAIFYHWFRRRQLTKATAEDELYMECARCHQRLRYRQSRAGQVGQCPRCKHRLIFPAPPEEEPSTSLPWWQPRRWWQPQKWRQLWTRKTELTEE